MKYFLVLFIVGALFACSNGGNAKVESNIAEGTLIGNRAPDIKYPNPEGKLYTLSDLRGKLVLIEFWASWCQPCRKENPHLVASYHEYKDKEYTKGNGFTIFSVSLDKEKSKWIEAIEKDSLVWEYHVSDLKEWYSVPASEYKVEAIPTNFLIDENGIIIAKDLRGMQLDEKLKELLRN